MIIQDYDSAGKLREKIKEYISRAPADKLTLSVVLHEATGLPSFQCVELANSFVPQQKKEEKK